MAKFKTTADVLLFKAARPGADSSVRLAEGTVFESDGVTVTSQTEEGVFHYLKAKVNAQTTGYVLKYHTEEQGS